MIEADIDRVKYEKKVKAFLKKYENEIAINKLKFNKLLTELDFQELVKIIKKRRQNGEGQSLLF